jgi:protein O-mannosyl-transferase
MHADSEIDPVVGIRADGKGIFSGLRWWPPLLVAAISAIAFLPALRNGYVDWDDNINFVQNLNFRGLGWSQLRWAWSETRIGVYQPLGWMLLELEYSLWGINPMGYHAASIVLHVLNMIVLYLLAYAIIRLSTAASPTVDVTQPRAQLALALAITLFAAHPLRAEVVAWVSCQPYLPCILFYMLSLICYLKYQVAADLGRRTRWMTLSVLCFGIAILMKAVAISLPVVLLVLDFYPLKRLGNNPLRWSWRSLWRILLEKLPYVAISALFVRVTLWARTREGHIRGEFDLAKAILRSCYGIVFYLWKTVIPLRLCNFYQGPDRLWLGAPSIAICVIVAVALCVAVIVRRRVWPALAAVWVIYLVVLAPNLGIVRVADHITADRYSYAATIAWAVLWAFLICRLIDRAKGNERLMSGFLGIGAGMAAWLVMLSWYQCRTWRDTKSLWINTIVQQGPTVAVAQRGLAGALMKEGRLTEAVHVCQNALPHLTFGHEEILCWLGEALDKMDRFEESVQAFEQALALEDHYNQHHPGDSKIESQVGLTLNNLGLALRRNGRRAEAEQKFRRAIESQRSALERAPGNRLYLRFLSYHYRNLAAVQRDLGRNQESLQSHQQALALADAIMLEPDLSDIGEWALLYYDVGNLLGDLNRPADSLQALERARSIAEHAPSLPSETHARCNLLATIYSGLADAMQKQGRREEAMALCRRAIEHERLALEKAPGIVQYMHILAHQYRNLARAQRDLGHPEDSLSAVREFEKLQPQDPNHLYEAACDFASCIPLSDGNTKHESTELAISALSRAIALGFKDVNQVRKENCLNPLRSRNDFKVLLAQLSKTSDAAR